MSELSAIQPKGREMTGFLLKVARESLGMSREELCFRMQQEQPDERWGYWRVANVELGKSSIAAHEMGSLAKILGVPQTFFIYGPGPFREDPEWKARMAPIPPVGIEVRVVGASDVTAR